MRLRAWLAMSVLTVAAWSVPAAATETITYSYDALGRLVTVDHAGSVNAGLHASYGQDPADNRTTVSVTGSAFSSTSRVFVVPLLGISVIPFAQ